MFGANKKFLYVCNVLMKQTQTYIEILGKLVENQVFMFNLKFFIMAKTKEKENKVFISMFAFEELKRLFEKQKQEIHYYRNALKYYQEKAQTIIF